MANNIYKKKDIKLDTFENLNKEMIASFSQGDRVSDKLVMQLSNNGVPLDLTDAVKVRIDFKKPDGKLVFQYCTMEDKPQGLISAILTMQTLASPGEVYAEVTVQYPDGKDAVTRQFTFWVQEAIASDKSIESQNEWPMLERAIVAGDMLAGVDLVAIIQAGELAAAALPKTGGTMTGPISFQTGGVAKELNWYNGTNQLGRLVMHPSGLVEWFGKDGATEKGAWNYSPVTNMFNVVSGTNLLKKTDAYTDYWQANGNTKVLATGTDLNTVQTTGASAGSGLVNAPEGLQNFMYIEVLRYSDIKYCKQTATVLTGGSSSRIFTRRLVNGVWENWTETIQSTGGVLSGTTTFNGVTNLRNNVEHSLLANPDKGVSIVINDSQSKWSIGPKMTGAVDWTKEMSMNLSTGRVTVAALTTKLDDTTTIPLSAEATTPDVNYPLQAVRRNNVVMLKGAVTLNANATGVIVATLPSDLRPAVGNLSIYTPTADTTTNVQVFVNGTTGAVAFSTNAKGKRVDFVLTYTT